MDVDRRCFDGVVWWNSGERGVEGSVAAFAGSTDVTPGCVLLRSLSWPRIGSCERE